MSEVSDLELKERFSIVPIMRAMHLDNVSEFSRWRIQFGLRYIFGG